MLIQFIFYFIINWITILPIYITVVILMNRYVNRSGFQYRCIIVTSFLIIIFQLICYKYDDYVITKEIEFALTKIHWNSLYVNNYKDSTNAIKSEDDFEAFFQMLLSAPELHKEDIRIAFKYFIDTYGASHTYDTFNIDDNKHMIFYDTYVLFEHVSSKTLISLLFKHEVPFALSVYEDKNGRIIKTVWL